VERRVPRPLSPGRRGRGLRGQGRRAGPRLCGRAGRPDDLSGARHGL